MANKHQSHGHSQHSNQQTGESPKNPFHVKLVTGGDESAPETRTPEDGSSSTEKPTPGWRFPNWCRNPDWWIVVLTFTLSIVGIFTVCYLRTQINDARDSFSQDQRPYIWVASGRGNVSYIVPAVGEKLKVMVTYSNYGKSPAILTKTDWSAEIGQNALAKIKKWPFEESHSVLPNGKVDWFTAFSTDKVDDTTQKNLMQDGWISVYGRIRYHDPSGHDWGSDVCMYSQRDGNWLYCPGEFNRLLDCSKESCD